MRFHTLLIVMTLLLVAAGATGCAGEPTSVATADALSATQERGVAAREVKEATMTPLPSPEPAGVTPPPEAEQVVQLATEDLAEQLGVEPEEIRLISVEAMEWSDASLGCPQPDMMYTQVITPGYKVVLEAQGERYEYHTDTATNVVLCQPEIGGTESDSPVTPSAATEGEPLADAKPPAAAEEAVKLAKEDLIKRLGVATDVIRLVSAEAVDWSDASLGCPQPGMMYAQVITPGFLVTIEAEGQQYEYHTDQGRFVVLCEE
jgi:hypothetical protein